MVPPEKWTTDNLKDLLDELIEGMRRENDDRDRLLVQIMDERQENIQRAIDKAEQSNERRFAIIQQFRQELAEQNARLLTRQEYDTAHDALVERVNEIQDRLNRSEGQGAGVRMTYGAIAVMVGAVASVVIIVNTIVVYVQK